MRIRRFAGLPGDKAPEIRQVFRNQKTTNLPNEMSMCLELEISMCLLIQTRMGVNWPRGSALRAFTIASMSIPLAAKYSATTSRTTWSCLSRT